MATASRIQAIQYDETTEVVEMQEFSTYEAALAWCEGKRGEKLHEGDTEFGVVLMAEADIDRYAETSIQPAMWFEIHGLTEDGEVDYLYQDE